MFRMIVLTLVLLAPLCASAMDAFVCEPEWGSLLTELAGDQANITVATTAFQDPHSLQARPSLIAAVRRADLIVCTGADLEIATQGNITALLWACDEGSVEIVQALIAAGADIQIRDFLNLNPLTDAIMYDRPDMIVPLLEAGVDPGVRISKEHAEPTFRGKNARELAVTLKRRKILKLLDEAGVQ